VNGKRLIGIALLVIGVILLVMGYNATQAPLEELSESFTGRFSDETMVYLIGGAVAAVVGLVMLLRK
jgi:drug/metabolite transporter (DMT)-like permease